MRMALIMAGALALTACTNRDEAFAFDGQYYRAKASKLDKDDRAQFAVSVKPVSASLDGAREAGRYEGTRYCIENYGTSQIEWSEGPDAEDGTLRVDNDTLLLQGECDP